MLETGMMQASEDPGDKAAVSLLRALAASADGQPRLVLQHAGHAVTQADIIGISSGPVRWARPLAARAAYELGEAGPARELLAGLDAYQPGHRRFRCRDHAATGAERCLPSRARAA